MPRLLIGTPMRLLFHSPKKSREETETSPDLNGWLPLLWLCTVLF